MSRKSTMIDAISIPNPCPAEWDSMTGTRRVRHCQECNKNVYNLSAMRRDDAEALIARFEGRLCARIERDDDGVIFDDDFRTAPQLISRRVSPVAAALVTALLGLSGNVMAMTSHVSAPVAIHAPADKDGRASQPQGATATISGVVKDQQGAVIPNAQVTLINEKTGEQLHTTAADAEGAFTFASLAEGTYTIKVEADGFAITQIVNVAIRAGTNERADVTLIVSARETLSGVVAAAQPQPLRALHHESDLIVVARLGRSTSVKTTETNEMMKTTLEVTSVVKGDNKRSRIAVYNWGWGENKEFPGGLKTGDTALFFLKPRAEGDGFEISDYSYGVKKLAPADMRVYLQRLEELNAMARAKQPDTATIVEWLVRCAEHRATRWDGAYELAQTADSDADDQNDAEDSDEPEKTMAAATISQVATHEPANPSDAQTATSAPTCSTSEDQARFAARLSDEQKHRLKAALFSIDALTGEDMILVTLVQHWKDERFVPFLLEQLRRVEASPPPLAERIINAIAEAMHDEEVKALAEDYSNNVSYSALDAKAEADSPEAESVDREEAETEDSDETSDTASDEAQEAMIARQKRSAMLQRFIALVEKKRAN